MAEIRERRVLLVFIIGFSLIDQTLDIGFDFRVNSLLEHLGSFVGIWNFSEGFLGTASRSLPTVFAS